MVIWTPRARADLKAIHDHIKKDSPQNAQRVVREILRKADGLTEVPHMGRVAPELNDPHLREIPAYSWRILYHLRAARCSWSHSSTSAVSPARKISHRTTSLRAAKRGGFLKPARRAASPWISRPCHTTWHTRIPT
jgi:toxin ParE1/3/4